MVSNVVHVVGWLLGCMFLNTRKCLTNEMFGNFPLKIAIDCHN